MPIVTRKAIRQQLMQTAVLDKIDREHLSVDTEAIRANLDTIRRGVQGKTMDMCVQRWEQLLRDDDPAVIRRIVLADDETGAEMRNLSPLTMLLTEQERLEVLDAVRHRAA